MSDGYDLDIEHKKRSITEKYRLAVIDEEDLKEVKSFRVSLLNIYIILSSAATILGVLIVCMIFFTPLKRLVPGYTDVNNNKEFRELTKKMNEIEESLHIQETYNESLRKLLQGGGISADIKIDQNASLPKVVNQQNRITGSIQPDDIDDQKMTKILGSSFFVTPVTGQISAEFLDTESHFGIDILAPKNTPVKNIMDGVVIGSDWTIDGGNTISIQHPNNILSVYKHNSALLKKSGDRVSAGEAIAIIGDSGTLTDGPHLHFELWYDGFPVDPQKYINF